MLLRTMFKVEEVVEEAETDEIFRVLEVDPEYPGGAAALMRYIQKNKQYPADCKKEGVQGRVIVQLVVNKVGCISDANIIKSVNPQFDAEALRVVKTMFNRIPDKKNGNAYAHYSHCL